MNNNKIVALEYILNGLMYRYRERVPDVLAISEAMIKKGIIDCADEIENDHIVEKNFPIVAGSKKIVQSLLKVLF